jgi:hypothetical protein
MLNTFEETGLEVNELTCDAAFAARKLTARNVGLQMAGIQRLLQALLERPDAILQELVNAAVELCGADSAGISVEQENGSENDFYHWVAVAGMYSGFLDAKLPRYPSACGICLERGTAQHFTVSQKFFELLDVQAPLVTDGILLPWRTEDTRGTIFVMAHGRTEAFDEDDARLMEMLAGVAAMGVKQQKQQKRLIAQERVAAAAQMANELAHQINNPLQSLTNLAYLLAAAPTEQDAKALQGELMPHLERLAAVVKQLLELPTAANRDASAG